jgi:dCMP deaminase
MMVVAHAFAQRGTCDRLMVGAVIHKRGRILATGYNGPPAGLAHCDHAHDEPVVGEERGCQRAVHAEANAIAFAARYGIQVDGCDLTVTHMPCIDCAKLIINSGLVSVVFEHPYRKTEGIDLLTRARIRVVNLVP